MLWNFLFYEINKNTCFYRTRLVAVSIYKHGDIKDKLLEALKTEENFPNSRNCSQVFIGVDLQPTTLLKRDPDIDVALWILHRTPLGDCFCASVQHFHDGGPCHRNQSIDFLCKSIDWLLQDRDLRNERFFTCKKLWFYYLCSNSFQLVTTSNFELRL